MVFGVLIVAGAAVLGYRHHEKKKARRNHLVAARAAGAAPTSEQQYQPVQANPNPPYYDQPNMSHIHNSEMPRNREQWDEPLPEWEAVAKIEEKQEKAQKY